MLNYKITREKFINFSEWYRNMARKKFRTSEWYTNFKPLNTETYRLVGHDCVPVDLLATLKTYVASASLRSLEGGFSTFKQLLEAYLFW